jgi:hypothetical protein
MRNVIVVYCSLVGGIIYAFDAMYLNLFKTEIGRNIVLDSLPILEFVFNLRPNALLVFVVLLGIWVSLCVIYLLSWVLMSDFLEWLCTKDTLY